MEDPSGNRRPWQPAPGNRQIAGRAKFLKEAPYWQWRQEGPTSPAKLYHDLLLSPANRVRWHTPSSSRLASPQHSLSRFGSDRDSASRSNTFQAHQIPESRGSMLSRSNSAPIHDSTMNDSFGSNFSGIGSVLLSPLSDSVSYNAKKSFSSLIHRDYSKTIELCEEALSTGGVSCPVLRYHARAKLKLGENEEALEDLTQALTIDPSSPHDWNSRAEALQGVGDYSGSIDDASHAIEINPYWSPMWGRRATGKLAMKDWESAKEDCDQALKLDPGESLTWRQRGAAKLALQDSSGAEADCSEAIHLDNTADSYLGRVQVRMQSGDFKGAIRDCSQALRTDAPEVRHLQAWNLRAVAKLRLTDAVGAMADCTEAIRLNPEHPKAWAIRTVAKIRLGDFAGVIEDATEALNAGAAEQVEMLFSRGRAYFQIGDYDSAALDFENALQVDPDCKKAMVMLEKSRKSLRHKSSWNLPILQQTWRPQGASSAGDLSKGRNLSHPMSEWAVEDGSVPS
eukprot:TRINITY_DN24941_c0_g1_i1.p1 TRINITY_DN24941_c0_g1~~TRINITY_DN24941_c0_g1_i1.p1  ORF type:complete len:511 (-),score=98.19 TRINITY_DN24941_c0_g1_i1:42-1574(-)